MEHMSQKEHVHTQGYSLKIAVNLNLLSTLQILSWSCQAARHKTSWQNLSGICLVRNRMKIWQLGNNFNYFC